VAFVPIPFVSFVVKSFQESVMKKIIFLIPLLVLSNLYAQQNGFIMEYKLDGSMIGNTKIDGNMEIIIKPHAKRITGNIVYEEPGNPFPTLDEQDILVDFDAAMKYHKTSESHGWMSGPLNADYNSLSDGSIKKSVQKEKGKDIVKVGITLPQSLGGYHTYTVELSWSKPAVAGEIQTFTKVGRPSATDLLSLFIDNEKIVEEIGKLAGDNRYIIPDSFTVTLEQDGKVQQTTKGVLRSKIVLVASDKWFKLK
jgi:hypothetical protein